MLQGAWPDRYLWGSDARNTYSITTGSNTSIYSTADREIQEELSNNLSKPQKKFIELVKSKQPGEWRSHTSRQGRCFASKVEELTKPERSLATHDAEIVGAGCYLLNSSRAAKRLSQTGRPSLSSTTAHHVSPQQDRPQLAFAPEPLGDREQHCQCSLRAREQHPGHARLPAPSAVRLCP